MQNYNYYLNFYRNRNESNFFAYLIRAAENTEYNHVEICAELKADTSVQTMYSAVIPQSRAISGHLIDKKYKLIKRRKLDVKVNDQEAFYILEKYLYREYSILQNFVILLKLTAHKFKNFFNSSRLNLDKYLNCTEYCSLFLEEACDKFFISTETVTLKELDKDEIGLNDTV